MLVTENALTDWITGEGFEIVEFNGELWGWTCLTSRQVGINRGLRQFQRIPTLLHEAHHVHRQDQGHQSPGVERRINESVARLLVDPVDYAWAETQYGWCTGGIAHALELPRWVVEAYRCWLSRNGGVPGGVLGRNHSGVVISGE